MSVHFRPDNFKHQLYFKLETPPFNRHSRYEGGFLLASNIFQKSRFFPPTVFDKALKKGRRFMPNYFWSKNKGFLIKRVLIWNATDYFPSFILQFLFSNSTTVYAHASTANNSGNRVNSGNDIFLLDVTMSYRLIRTEYFVILSSRSGHRLVKVFEIPFEESGGTAKTIKQGMWQII